LAYDSAFSREEINVGALKAMHLIGAKLPVDTVTSREFFIEKWLSEKTSIPVKIAALKYLRYYGVYEDLKLIKAELDRGNSQTTTPCIEAIISIKLRYNKTEAVTSAIELQYESMDKKLIQFVLSSKVSIDESLLLSGLKHRNKYVRAFCLNKLENEDKISVTDAKNLKEDSDAFIRYNVVKLLLKKGEVLSDDDIKKILIKPTKISGFGLFSMYGGGKDNEGEKYYNQYISDKHLKMDEAALKKEVTSFSILDDNAYFALNEKFFKKYSSDLRKNLENEFKDFFLKEVSGFEQRYVKDSEMMQKIRNIEVGIRDEWVRKGIAVLLNKGNQTDITLVRNNFRKNLTRSTTNYLNFFKKFGEWEDIQFITKAQDAENASTSLLGSFSSDSWNCLIAETIYNIGNSKFEELLNIPMPSAVLEHLINTSSNSKFAELSDKAVFALLANKNDIIRKAAVLKCIQALTKTKIKSILATILAGTEYRYYNVIYWLDFGINMPKEIINRAVGLNLENKYAL
jgi:hypothetical protein